MTILGSGFNVSGYGLPGTWVSGVGCPAFALKATAWQAGFRLYSSAVGGSGVRFQGRSEGLTPESACGGTPETFPTCV